MDRRTLIKTAALGAIGAALPGGAPLRSQAPASSRFKLRYAPHFGMFREHAGDDLLDQLRFMRDEGFVAVEDNGMPRRDAETQQKIGAELERLEMEMGVFVAHADFQSTSFVDTSDQARERIETDMKAAVEIAKRCNATWCTVVPGTYNRKLEWDYQTANVIENLKRAAAILEPSGLVMVLEPLNHWTNHPGVFLTGVPQAFQICQAVDSPSCKILDDLYHQQITEGNLIPNIDKAWSQIAYIQVGDNPGRKEPTTGEINYRNVFRHLHQKGYDDIVGMEHGNSRPGRDGERAVIDAYVEVDDF